MTGVTRQASPSGGSPVRGAVATGVMTTSKPTAARGSVRQRRCMRRLLVGAAPLLLFLLIAIVGPVVWPYDSVTVRTGERLKPPLEVLRDGSTALFGTDQVGRDL